MPNESLKVIPLGGLGEVGKNMMVLETDEDIVVIDAGVLFPEDDMPGIDIVVPNVEYLVENLDRVRAILITHGHEDHIGALPHILGSVPVPIYAPPMAAALIRNKLRERGRLRESELITIGSGERIKFGNTFEAEWFDVCHSIPDAMGIALRTPLGTVVHTGDFRLDNDPTVGEPTDFAKMAEIAADGVFLLMADSTYAENEGYSGSDREVAQTLHDVIGGAEGRVLVASFASQIARVQMIADAAVAHGRRLAVVGRSMINNIKIARELGHLNIREDTMIDARGALGLPANRVVYMSTGAQGEPQSALARMAAGTHNDVDIRNGDTIIISATPIPGNETAVSNLINDLVEQGAKVVTHNTRNVHVHGHAAREELRAVHNLLQPRHFVPIHGEYRMLKAHVDLAIDHGVHEEDAFLLTDGDILRLTDDGGEVVGEIPAGHVFIHGHGVWDEHGNVIVERRLLASEGFVVVILGRDSSGRVSGRPKIVSSGFVHYAEADRLFEDAVNELNSVLDRDSATSIQWSEVEATVKKTVGRFFTQRTRRRPTIIPVAFEV
ncbi:MAG: ribonuclease J [Chloroflexi bacterium]|nr:ribonuclease J [Chloroflexota bacterium]